MKPRRPRDGFHFWLSPQIYVRLFAADWGLRALAGLVFIVELVSAYEI